MGPHRNYWGKAVRMSRMKLRIALVALAIAGSSLLMPTAHADGGPKIITGWMPYWITSQSKPAGITSAVTNADLLKDVSPFWFSAVAGGPAGVTVKFNPNFGSAEANSAWAVGQLRGAGLAILPSIADGSGKGRMAATLADPAKRAIHIADIVNLVTSRGYDGIDLDYETFAFTDGRASWPATQPNWTAFVTELSAALHGQGKLLSVTIPSPCDVANKCGGTNGYWVYNIAGIATPSDRIRLMTYDFHVGSPGPIAPMSWVTASMQYAATQAPANKLTVGVPAYGRTWTKKNGSTYALSGVCPPSGSSGAIRTAYNSLTSSASLTAAEIPAFLASIGKTPADVQWDPVSQENWIEYNKSVNWTDGSGAQQICVAQRIMWWIGPQAALVRTQLVGQLGLNSAGFWTIGGDDPAMWPLLRGYSASMAPAATAVAITAPTTITFNTIGSITGVSTSQGTPVTGVDAALQFQSGGKGPWTQISTAPLAPDGTVTFAPTFTATGKWRIYIPAAVGRGEQASEAKQVSVATSVKANAKKPVVKANSKLVIRVVALPAQGGQPIVVQEQRAGVWVRVAKSTTQATGIARVVLVAPKAKGVHTYRATANSIGALSFGVSEPFTVTVN
jgi:spore germination protein YaaH